MLSLFSEVFFSEPREEGAIALRRWGCMSARSSPLRWMIYLASARAQAPWPSPGKAGVDARPGGRYDRWRSGRGCGRNLGSICLQRSMQAQRTRARAGGARGPALACAARARASRTAPGCILCTRTHRSASAIICARRGRGPVLLVAFISNYFPFSFRTGALYRCPSPVGASASADPLFCACCGSGFYIHPCRLFLFLFSSP